MTHFRIAPLFEVIFLVAVFLVLLFYIPLIGLFVPSLYASTRAVTRSVRQRNRNLNHLMKTGAIWGIFAMYTIGTLGQSVLLVTRFSEPFPLAEFIFGYGGIAAGLGALIGQWTRLYLSWHEPGSANSSHG